MFQVLGSFVDAGELLRLCVHQKEQLANLCDSRLSLETPMFFSWFVVLEP
jgi:hypothetical protein